MSTTQQDQERTGLETATTNGAPCLPPVAQEALVHLHVVHEAVLLTDEGAAILDQALADATKSVGRAKGPVRRVPESGV